MAIINELTTDDAPETADAAVTNTPEDAAASTEMGAEGPVPTGPQAEKGATTAEKVSAKAEKEGAAKE
jgi:hypothetical protein